MEHKITTRDKTEQNKWGNYNTHSGNNFKSLTLKNTAILVSKYYSNTEGRPKTKTKFWILWFNSNIKLPPPTAQMHYILNFCVDTYLIHAPCMKIKYSVEIEGRCFMTDLQGYCEEENGIKDWIMIMEHSRKLTITRLFW